MDIDVLREGGVGLYRPERYFTDGVTLYWLVGWLNRPGRAALAKLEDCRSLSSELVELEALLKLRPVAVAA
jgi:hypothetical protein